MSFPNIYSFPETDPERIDRHIGSDIAGLLAVFAGRVPDAESYARALELANAPERWSGGHAVFDAIRHRSLAIDPRQEKLRKMQYAFEEYCCKAMYNASRPSDPFDREAAFLLLAYALGLAKVAGVPFDEVIAVFDWTWEWMHQI
jgi:hypothetical protein